MRRSALTVMWLAALAGCQIRPTFTTGYQVTPGDPTPPADTSLAVTQFSEARPPRHYQTTGRMFLLYVPLIPYASLEFERTDENVAELSKDIARYGSHGSLPEAPPFDTYAYPISVPRALADAAEAAVRSLKEKTPTRIEQTVEKVIYDIFAEAQLDECDLTLKDLNSIVKAFNRILLGIYHQRIEYPVSDAKVSDASV